MMINLWTHFGRHSHWSIYTTIHIIKQAAHYRVTLGSMSKMTKLDVARH